MNAQQAAAQTRSRIVKKIRSMTKRSWGTLIDGGCLVQWILRMDERQNKRIGGLGRK